MAGDNVPGYANVKTKRVFTYPIDSRRCGRSSYQRSKRTSNLLLLANKLLEVSFSKLNLC